MLRKDEEGGERSFTGGREKNKMVCLRGATDLKHCCPFHHLLPCPLH